MELPDKPVSDCHGFDRGTPVDRVYIEAFLDRHREHIRGDGAEVKDDAYLRRFGAGRIRSTTVVDLDPANPHVDLRVDLTKPGSLPVAAFDCIVLTQVLHLVTEPALVVAHCGQALRPGGTLLMTVPTIARLSPSHPRTDRWRFTPAGVEHLLAAWPGPREVAAHGNLRVAFAALLGEAAEELPEAAFDHDDPAFPVVTCAAARRPPSAR